MGLFEGECPACRAGRSWQPQKPFVVCDAGIEFLCGERGADGAKVSLPLPIGDGVRIFVRVGLFRHAGVISNPDRLVGCGSDDRAVWKRLDAPARPRRSPARSLRSAGVGWGPAFLLPGCGDGLRRLCDGLDAAHHEGRDFLVVRVAADDDALAGGRRIGFRPLRPSVS